MDLFVWRVRSCRKKGSKLIQTKYCETKSNFISKILFLETLESTDSQSDTGWRRLSPHTLLNPSYFSPRDLVRYLFDLFIRAWGHSRRYVILRSDCRFPCHWSLCRLCNRRRCGCGGAFIPQDSIYVYENIQRRKFLNTVLNQLF